MHEFQVQKVFTTQPILHHQRIIKSESVPQL